MTVGFRCLRRILLLTCAVAVCSSLYGYSVLSHEAVIDALWDVELKAVLLARFPNASPEELKTAHGYAYGGAIIQDLGYYPHGSKKFSDLTHYTRTGDFILALIAESQTLNEYAFALGALSHYVSDLDGHRYATNVGEPILYPKLENKYGNVITYEQDPLAHLMTEFGFDVLEVAKGNFAPQAYHDFIGFDVAKDLLQRAFRDTYGLDLQDVFGDDFDRAIGSYRRDVSKTIPKATRIAWAQKKNEIQKAQPGTTKQRFIYVMRRWSYERNWGKDYDRPSTGERILAVLLKLIPPIGPLRALHFKMPTPPVESLFRASFNRSAGQYREKLQEAEKNILSLPDANYDVGTITPPGAYRLADEACAYWLDQLANKNFNGLTPEIRASLLEYYGNLSAPITTKRDHKKWTRLLAELQALKDRQPSAVSASQGEHQTFLN